MAVPDAEIANQFRAALEVAVGTGDLAAVYPLLATDVEWVTPQRTLRGLDEVKEQLDWIKPSETFDFEFSEGDWVDQGDGRLALDVCVRWPLETTFSQGCPGAQLTRPLLVAALQRVTVARAATHRGAFRLRRHP